LFARKKDKKVWINIGGRIEKGETPIECLQRELREEIQSEIDMRTLRRSSGGVFKEFLRTPPTPALDDPDKTVQIIWYKVSLSLTMKL